jgi:hypothetical protein
MKKSLYLIPTLLLLAACQQAELERPSSQEPKDPAETPQTWNLTIRATRGDSQTKALALEEGVSLHSYWKDTEKVQVYKDGVHMGYLDVTPDAGEEPSTATLSGGSINGDLAQDDELTLLFPRHQWSYTGQKGTLTGSGSVEDSFAYAMATVTVESVSGTSVTTTPASFTNGQSIYRISFKAGESYIDPVEFTVSTSAGKLVKSLQWENNAWTPTYDKITVIPSAAASDHFYYMALRNESTIDDTYSFVITGADQALYLGSFNLPASALEIPRFISAKNFAIAQPSFAPAFGDTDNASDVY